MRGSISNDPKAVTLEAPLITPSFVMEDDGRQLKNSVHSAIYNLPPIPEGHVFTTQLLSGVVLPPPLLTPEDFRMRRNMRVDVRAAGRFTNRATG